MRKHIYIICHLHKKDKTESQVRARRFELNVKALKCRTQHLSSITRIYKRWHVHTMPPVVRIRHLNVGGDSEKPTPYRPLWSNLDTADPPTFRNAPKIPGSQSRALAKYGRAVVLQISKYQFVSIFSASYFLFLTRGSRSKELPPRSIHRHSCLEITNTSHWWDIWRATAAFRSPIHCIHFNIMFSLLLPYLHMMLHHFWKCVNLGTLFSSR